MSVNDYVRARTDPMVKNEAANVLSTLGLTVEKLLPFGTEEPNEESLAAIREIEEGRGVRFNSAEALFKDLGI